MNITSHFIWIELNQEVFKSMYSKISDFLVKNNLNKIIILQNINTIHITLYYLDKNLDNCYKNNIKSFIKKIDISNDIYLKDFKYFYRNKKEILLYLETNTSINLLEKRNILNNKFKEKSTEDNDLKFISHITLFRILDYEKFITIKKELEKIILAELEKFSKININNKKIFLYAVDSTQSPELQVKL